MTFRMQCMAGELARALALASQVIGGPKVPVLRAVVVTADKDGAQLAATNTDHAIRASFAAEGEGEAFIDMALFAQKANALRGEQPVSMATDAEGKFLTMTQGKTRYRLPVLLGTGFPVDFTKPMRGDPIALPQGPLVAAMGAIASVVTPDTSHILGSGILLDMGDDKFRVVAAQKRGLAVVEIDAPALPVSVIVPLDTVRAILAIFKGAEILQVISTKDGICVEHDGVMYRSKLVEGTYPDWRRARDIQFGKVEFSAEVDAAEFRGAMARAAAIADDQQKGQAVTGVRLTFDGNECAFSAKNRTGEEGFDACEAGGDSGTFGMGIANLSEFLASITGGRLRIQFGDEQKHPDSHGVIISPEPAGGMDDYRIVMTMRV